MSLVSRFVMTTGVSVGIGKSTVTAGLAAWAASANVELELFDVEQIFSRDAFSDIGRAFRDRTYPTAEMMLLGYASLISELGPSRAVLFDWSCLSMVSDLPWAEGRPDVLLRHAVDVLELARPLRPVLLNLVGDVEVAVARAAAERGERWVRRHARLAAMGGVSSRMPLEAIAEWIKRQPYEALELEAFREAGWPVWETDAMQPAEEVIDDVAIRLGIPQVEYR